MTVHLAGLADADADAITRHERFLALTNLAVYDDATIHTTLHADTRRGVSAPLAELLLLAGRAQPVISAQTRTTRRDEAWRLQVALTGTGRDVVILGAEHLHRHDIALLVNVTAAAGVDLWLALDGHAAPQTADALDAAAEHSHTLEQAVAMFTARPTADGRRHPSPCESALPVSAGTGPGRGCRDHDDAAGCVLASFGDALATARTNPDAVRARLHELTRALPEDRRWAIYAVARDPWRFARAALEPLPIDERAWRGLTIAQLAADASHLALRDGPVRIPAHLRPVIAAHRDIRLTEGARPGDLLLAPATVGRRSDIPRVR